MKKIVQISVTVTILSMFFLSLAYADKWAAAKNLSNNEGDSYDPAIAADGLNLYVVWSGGYDIYFKRSENGGASWKPVRQITGTSAAAHKPVIAVDGLNIYVAWYEKIQPGYYDIYFTRSSNGGATWKPKQQFANISFGVWPCPPALAVNGSKIYLVYSAYRSGKHEIYLRRSVDGGASWKAEKRLTVNAGDSWAPAIAVNGLNVYVVWSDNTPGNREILFRRSDDGGIKWQPAKRLTNMTGDSDDPSIAVNGSNIYIAWTDFNPGEYDIFFRRSGDGGNKWQRIKQLTNNAGFSMAPALAVGGSNIYLGWQDYSVVSNNDTYFTLSVNGGGVWKPKEQLTKETGNSASPAICANGLNIYVVWEDDALGWNKREVYFKKGVLD